MCHASTVRPPATGLLNPPKFPRLFGLKFPKLFPKFPYPFPKLLRPPQSGLKQELPVQMAPAFGIIRDGEKGADRKSVVARKTAISFLGINLCEYLNIKRKT